MRTIAPTATSGATDINITQKLHFYFFKAGAAACLTLALSGVETEGTRTESALASQFGTGKQFSNVVERADIDGRVRARGSAQGRLVHKHHIAERIRAVQLR